MSLTKVKWTNLIQKFPKALFHCSAIVSQPVQSPEEKRDMPVFKYASNKKTRSSRIYLWGSATTGALGESRYLRPTSSRSRILYTLHKPGRLEFAEEHEVTDVACGFGFTVFAVKSDDKNKVFGTGINSSSQIGVHEVRKGHPLEFLLRPIPVHIPFANPSQTKVVQVACGRAHTIVLTDKEGAFSLGNNVYGQCGRPIVPKEDYWANSSVHKVRGLDGIDVTKVVCGLDHTLFLTSTGQIYACGWGADGQTGLGHYKTEWKPTLIQGDLEKERIVHLAGAGDIVLAVSDKGDVFGWGNSEYKQLRTATDEQQLNLPRHLKIKNDGKFLEVAAAGTMCAALNDKGQVCVWGYGILGKGPEVEALDYPEWLPEPLFGCNTFSPDVSVKHIYSAINHFAAVTNKGDLFMWGKNSRSCLGLGNPKDQYFPLKVSVPAEVVRVSCGVDHTAAVCRSFM